MTQPAKNLNQAPPSKPAAPERVFRLVDPDHTLVVAAFTERELFQLRNVCRDSDNENALRFLEAALARAGGKP